MKILTLISLAAFGLSAHAIKVSKKEVEQRLKGNKISGKISSRESSTQPGQPIPQPQEPLEPITPTRTGRMKVKVTKTQIIKNSDDSYSATFSNVCTGEVDMNVYDYTNLGNGYFDYGPGFNCTSTIDGQPVAIKVVSAMFLWSWILFEDPAPSVVKSGYASLYVTDSSDSVVQGAWGNMVSTRDLNNRSLVSSAGSGGIMICTPSSDGSGEMNCVGEPGEFFSMEYELIDNP